jgi:hypothetical protein
MARAQASASRLSEGEQRVLSSFLAGRLPAGRLNDELCRAREAALASAAEAGTKRAAPALRAA